MKAEHVEDLIQQAKGVLERNWLGHATRPAPRLPPHQWRRDSAFIAISYAHYDQAKAEQELLSLFRGQWTNGMLPHIVFQSDGQGHFPGPGFWRVHRSPHAPDEPATSGIVQPPVHATAAWHVHRYAEDKRRSQRFLEAVYPQLRAWHAYLYRERDPMGVGLVYLRHPWEAGQDNSPIWDRVLERTEVTPETVPPRRHVDIEVVDGAGRLSAAEYDCYAYLVKLAYDHGYDEYRIWESNPFLVQDVLFNALLVQANRDLAEIARVLGEDPGPWEGLAERTATAMNTKLWDEEHGIYFDYDLVAGELVQAHVAAGFSPLYAGVPEKRRAARMVGRLNSNGFYRLNDACWAVPSYDREEPGLSPDHPWRGPIWINVNWVLYHGLRRYGYDDCADRVKEAICEMPRRWGFREHFDPDTGRGHGSGDFSWTAALALDLLLETQRDA